jgi:hypothetical protein
MKNTTMRVLIHSVLLLLWGILVAWVAPPQPQANLAQTTPTTEPTEEQNSFVLPTLVPPDVLIPFPTPAEAANLIVLSLVVSDTLTLDPAQSTITRGYGSNALNPRAGEWTVALLSQDGNRYDFAVEDPGAVFVYNADDDEQTHTVVQDAPPIYLDGAPNRWNLTLPLIDELRGLEIHKLEVLDEERHLRFSAGIDLDEEEIIPLDIGELPPIGEITGPEELAVLDDELVVAVDPLLWFTEVDAFVGEDDQPGIAVESGQLVFMPQANSGMTWVGFQLIDTPEWGRANPIIAFRIDDYHYIYRMDQLELQNGHVLRLRDGNEVMATVTQSAQGWALDLSTVSGAPIEELTIFGEQFQLSNITVQTEQ